MIRRAAPIVVCLPMALLACASGDRADPIERRVNSGPSDETPEQTDTRRVSFDPPAFVGGRPVRWTDLRPVLVEAAGGEALEEVILDRLIEQRLESENLEVTPMMIDRERRLLIDSLRESSGGDAVTAEALLERVRRSRGLGERRFANLLRRTAALRALTADRVSVGEGDVERIHAIRHGPTQRVRLITVGTLGEAETALRRVRGGEPFAEVAARVSTDASASRGGLLAPLSVRDPSYPRAMREAIGGLAEGEVSEPIAIDTGYALVKIEETIPADGTDLERVRNRLEREARLQQERVLMAQLADRLLAGASLSIVDPALERSWERRRSPR